MNTQPKGNWRKSENIKKELIADGWASPDTYDNYFKPEIDGPAVYLFLLFNREERYSHGLVAYVGMSQNLRSRWETHNILPTLYVGDYWPQRWFKPVDVSELRSTERSYIERFDPPWNIVGRKRGLVLA